MCKISRIIMFFVATTIVFLYVFALSSFASEGMTACAMNNNGQLRLEVCDVMDSSGCLPSEYCVKLGGPLPDGMIAFFAGNCPGGWVEYEAARGFAIVGAPEMGALSGTKGTPLTDLEDRIGHTHAHNHGSIISSSNGAHNHSGFTTSEDGDAGEGLGSGDLVGDHSHFYETPTEGGHTHAVTLPGITSDSPETPYSATDEDVLPYIQLLACIKQSVECGLPDSLPCPDGKFCNTGVCVPLPG